MTNEDLLQLIQEAQEILEGRLWDEKQGRAKAIVRDIARKQVPIRSKNMDKHLAEIKEKSSTMRKANKEAKDSYNELAKNPYSKEVRDRDAEVVKKQSSAIKDYIKADKKFSRAHNYFKTARRIANRSDFEVSHEDLLQLIQEAQEILESLTYQVLKKETEQHPNKHMISKEGMDKYNKADSLKRKAYSQIVKSAGGLKNYIDSGRGTTKNKEGELKTDFRRGPFTQDLIDYKRGMDPFKQEAIKKSIARHKNKMTNEDLLQLIQEAHATITNLFEVDDKEQEINKLAKEKDKKTEIVSVEDELFPPKGNTAKQQFNQKVIDMINQMIEGKANLEDLLRLTRSKMAARKSGLTESYEAVIEAANELLDILQIKE